MYVTEEWQVSAQDLPVLVVSVETGGELACGQWESSYEIEYVVAASSFAEQCPGDKDGDGDADIDDLIAVMDWLDVMGVDALIDVIVNWGCEG